MQYFNTLPKIVQYDSKGTGRIFTNLLARASVIPELLKNPALYYQYDIQDGDTPEIVAHKYYGDSYRYWIVLFVNQLSDAQWDWPLSGTVFQKYILSKYPDIETSATLHHYEKIVSTYNTSSLLTTTNKVTIDADTFNSLNEYAEQYTVGSDVVVVSVTKGSVTVYDYELDLNEQKRNIKLLNSIYVNQVEEEFKKLMAK